MKRQTAKLYLDALARYEGTRQGKLLDVGCGNGELLHEASRKGFEVCGLDVSGHAVQRVNALLGWKAVSCSTIEHAGFPERCFDVCVCADVIEHTRNPIEFLSHVHRVLKPDGILLLVTPALDSWPARLMKRRWFEFKTEHLHYFSRSALQNALLRTGFRSVEVAPARKILTLDYICRHFQRYPVPIWSALLRFLCFLLPSRIRNAPFTAQTGSVIALARASVKSTPPLLSVIVPVYNERKTVAVLLETLIAKQLQGVDKEIIVVEGNSNDGSREDVLRFKDAPGVRIVLQDRNRGKGFAVRQGLCCAKGDIILIQDSDLEYDIDDYDELLEPIRSYRQAVVLGSRHLGNEKMRVFTDQRFLELAFNSGHIFLTFLFNLLYGQALKDPWTMYKVFRSDCLHKLEFECNRFNFDVELLAKLVRKGFTPVEILVRYKSRSFKDGKKIRVMSDPWTWIWACLKYRIVSPYNTNTSPAG
jgi:SAM-dependent methyltransferase